MLASRFFPATGWSTPSVVSAPGSAVLGQVKVLVSGAGNAQVLWPQMVGLRTELWSARFTASGWKMPTRVSPDGMGLQSSLAPIFSADGDVRGRTLAVFVIGDMIWQARFE